MYCWAIQFVFPHWSVSDFGRNESSTSSATSSKVSFPIRSWHWSSSRVVDEKLYIWGFESLFYQTKCHCFTNVILFLCLVHSRCQNCHNLMHSLYWPKCDSILVPCYHSQCQNCHNLMHSLYRPKLLVHLLLFWEFDLQIRFVKIECDVVWCFFFNILSVSKLCEISNKRNILVTFQITFTVFVALYRRFHGKIFSRKSLVKLY